MAHSRPCDRLMVSPFCSLGSSLPQALIKSDLSERPVGYSSVISHQVKVTENTPEPYPRWASSSQSPLTELFHSRVMVTAVLWDGLATGEEPSPHTSVFRSYPSSPGSYIFEDRGQFKHIHVCLSVFSDGKALTCEPYTQQHHQKSKTNRTTITTTTNKLNFFCL